SLGVGSFLAVDFRGALVSRRLIGCSALVGICRLCGVVRFGCLTVPAFCRRVLVVAFCNLAFLLRRRRLVRRRGVLDQAFERGWGTGGRRRAAHAGQLPVR